LTPSPSLTHPFPTLASCDAVITVSGTATLEVALLGVPMVIVYRLAPLSYWIGRLLVSIDWMRTG
jgi:lipid-A-disaccharide synthase